MRGIVKGVVGWTLGLIRKEEHPMRKSIVFAIALTTVAFVAGEASATKLTEQQVKNTCAGQNIQESSKGWGCVKQCGDKTCEYGCSKDKDGKSFDCKGVVQVVRSPSTLPKLTPKAPPSRVTPAPSGTLQKSP